MHRRDLLLNRAKLDLRSLYEDMTQPDINMDKLNEIDKKLTEEYLGYYYSWDLEKQLREYCKDDPHNRDLNNQLLDLAIGQSMEEIFSMSKIRRLAILFR
jgi:hypothetical protein